MTLLCPRISKKSRRHNANCWSKASKKYRQTYPMQDDAMAMAYRSGAYTMKKIGESFGVHYMTASYVVRKFETQ